MKGVELPINILVVVAIAVIVLLGLVALYFIGFNPFSQSTAVESIKNEGCRLLTTQNPPCNSITNVNVQWQGASTDFEIFMAANYGCNVTNASDSRGWTPTESCVRARCTCPGI